MGRLDRESKIHKNDIPYLIRLMHKAEESLLQYGLAGCQKTGINDDMFTCVALLELRKVIDRVLKDDKENTQTNRNM